MAFVTTLLCLWSVGAAKAQPRSSDLTITRIDTLLARMAHLRLFSGQVLIARHDTVLLSRAYGWAERAVGARASVTTLFDIGSIAKQFTGAALLAMESEGLLSTSDSIVRWLPNVPVGKRGITIEQLATHTSGLPRDLQDDANGVLFGLPGERDSVVRAILDRPLSFQPGTRFQYSNIGYILLAAIVEQASQRPFTEVVRDHLWRVAGLQRTRFVGEVRRDTGTVARGMWEHYDDISPRDRPTSWFGLGGSQVVSTAEDLQRWQQALWGGRVLAPSALAKLTKPIANNYGYGWYALPRPDGTTGLIYHVGVHPNSLGAEFRFYPTRGLVVVVLTNLRHWDVLMQEDVISNIADLMTAADSGVAAVPAVEYPAIESFKGGTYRLASGGTVELIRDERGEEWIAPLDQPAFAQLAPVPTASLGADGAVARTHALIDSLSAGRCPAPSTGLPLSAGDQSRAWQLRERWCEYRLKGSVGTTEVLGVWQMPWSDAEHLVFTRTTFGGHARTVTWRWVARGLVTSWSSPNVTRPQALPLGTRPGGGWLLYDWFRGRTLGVRAVDGVVVLHDSAGRRAP